MNYDITDEELRIGAAEYREDMLEALHETFGQDYEHSAENEVLAREAVRINKKRKHTHLALKRVATVLICMFISTGTVLSFSEEARAFVSDRFRELLHDKIVYHFMGKDNGEPIPKCRLGWIPEGFVEVNRTETDFVVALFLENDEGNIIVFDYSRIGVGGASELKTDNDNLEKIHINGIEVDYYAPQFDGDTANLIWTDIKNNVDCMLDCDLDKETIVKIVENITFE